MHLAHSNSINQSTVEASGNDGLDVQVDGKTQETPANETRLASERSIENASKIPKEKTDNLELNNFLSKDIQPLKDKIRTGMEQQSSSKLAEKQGNTQLDSNYSSSLKKSKREQPLNKTQLNIDGSDLPEFGHFLWDKPQSIAKIEHNPARNDLDVYVTWCARPNGTVPQPTRLARIDILKYDPIFLAYEYEKALTISNISPDVNLQNLRRV